MSLPDPIHHWKFDEASGNTATDSNGGATITIHEGGSLVSIASERSGNGLQLTSPNNVESDAPEIPAPWTLSCWVRRDAESTSSSLLSGDTTAIKLEQWDLASHNINEVTTLMPVQQY